MKDAGPHGQQVRHLCGGRWWDEVTQTWRNGRRRLLLRLAPVADVAGALITKVVLTTAHLDHDPTDNRPRNLRAFCQHCHMIQDRDQH